MSYVYIRSKSEPGLRTVGFYQPDGKWEPESDHESEQSAVERVHYLNGGDATAERQAQQGRELAELVQSHSLGYFFHEEGRFANWQCAELIKKARAILKGE